MRPNIEAGLSCVVALVLCCLAGVAAPPSEFVRETTIWTRLDPLMWPCLFAGPALALLACALLPFTTRGAAALCIAAVGASMLGVSLAWGIDAQAGLRGLVVPIGILGIPALGALSALRHR